MSQILDPADLAQSGNALPGANGAEIARIETIRSMIQPNVTHVLITDTDGIQGLGETFYGASSVEAHLHDVIIPSLQAERPEATPDAVSAVIEGYVGYSGSGSEVRARSAIDIALWDIQAKRAGQPLHRLLRSASGSSIPSYNTCSGINYVNAESRQSSSNWGLPDGGGPGGEFEDLWAFLNNPARLARELVDSGFPGMKVWPFDLAAESTRGQTGADLSFGLSVLDAIRSEVGDSIKVYLELHSLWSEEAAIELIKQLAPYNLAWVEDPIRPDHVPELARLRDIASMPVAVGENLGAGANGYRTLVEEGGADVVIMDLGWCGGISEALDTMALTQQHGLEIAFHDCTGPVSLAVATHASLACVNAPVQEVARAFWHGWYPQMANGYPELSQGILHVSDEPGHGTTLNESFLRAPGTTTRSSVMS